MTQEFVGIGVSPGGQQRGELSENGGKRSVPRNKKISGREEKHRTNDREIFNTHG